MALPPQKFREMIFQMLYSIDMGKTRVEDLIPLIMQELAVTKSAALSAFERVEEIQAKQNEIDTAIGDVSHSYNFERIPGVERNILRLAIYEILFDAEVPPKVSIAEAMRLARKFSTPEASRFVNALLDTIYKRHEGQATPDEELKEATESLIQSEEQHRLASEQPKPQE